MVSLESTNIGLKQGNNPQATAGRQTAITLKPPITPKAKTEPETKTKISEIISKKVKKINDAEVEAQKYKTAKERNIINRQMLEEAAEKVKRLAEYISENTHLIARDYRVHEQTNRITVKIYDSVTGEVIREVPGRDFLDRVARMEQLMGIIFDNLV